MYRKYSKTEPDKLDITQTCRRSIQLGELTTYFKKLKYEPNNNSLLTQQEVIDFFRKKIDDDLSLTDTGYEFYDLFCGAGGLSLGFEKNGFKVKKAVEKDLSAVKTYHFNRPWLSFSQIIQDDITKHTDDFELEYAPLIVGGPPCQGFSNANKQKKANDSRNELYKFFVKKVESVNPEIFIMENVTGILKHIHHIKGHFDAINYSTSAFTLDTSDFGFPQNRKRVFILGYKKSFHVAGINVKELFEKAIKSHITDRVFYLHDAISTLPHLVAKTRKNATNLESDSWGGTFLQPMQYKDDYSILLNGKPKFLPVLNHKAKFNNERDIEIYSLLSPGDNSDNEKIAHINPYISRSAIFKDKFFKLEPKKPCKTLTSHMYYDCHMYIHPNQSRGLTPREAARIQGFPDDYLFLGTPNEWYRQVGNAVSPLISNILGSASKKILNRLFAV